MILTEHHSLLLNSSLSVLLSMVILYVVDTVHSSSLDVEDRALQVVHHRFQEDFELILHRAKQLLNVR